MYKFDMYHQCWHSCPDGVSVTDIPSFMMFVKSSDDGLTQEYIDTRKCLYPPVSYNLSEHICTDYTCKCGGDITSGIRLPDADYDDWLVKPHCTSCGVESASNKNPFKSFISRKKLPTKYIYIVKNDKICTVGISNSEFASIDSFDFGGGIYKDATIEKMSSVTPIDGETEEEFFDRVYCEKRRIELGAN